MICHKEKFWVKWKEQNLVRIVVLVTCFFLHNLYVLFNLCFNLYCVLSFVSNYEISFIERRVTK